MAVVVRIALGNVVRVYPENEVIIVVRSISVALSSNVD